MFKMSAFSFDTRRESFAKAQNRFVLSVLRIGLSRSRAVASLKDRGATTAENLKGTEIWVPTLGHLRPAAGRKQG